MGIKGGFRHDLAAYLVAEYQHGVPWRIVVPHLSADGYELRDVELAQAEVAGVLRDLPRRQRQVLALRFGKRWGAAAICERLGLCKSAYHRELCAALDAVLALAAERSRTRAGPAPRSAAAYSFRSRRAADGDLRAVSCTL